MNWKILAGAVAIGGGLMMGAGAAQAQVYVVDSPSATQCFEAAYATARNDRAISDCDAALQSDGLKGRNLAGTYTNRGVLRLRAGATESAMKDFDTALNIDQQLGEAWVDRAIGLLQQARYQEAIGNVDRGLPLVSRDQAMGLYVRAIARENVDDDAGAYRDYTAAVRAAPTWEAPRMQLSRFEVRHR